MKNRLKAILAIGVISTGFLAGSTAVVSAEQSTAVEAPSQESDKETAVELKTIGKEEKDCFQVKLKNATGKDLKAISIMSTAEKELPENMLEEKDIFAKDEERMVFYSAPEITPEEDIRKYDIELTFEDDSKAVLHTFPFGDTEEAEIRLEEKVAYIVFESTSLKKEIITKETETSLAQEAAAPAETAPAESSSYTDSSSDYGYDYGYDYSYDYSYSISTDYGSGGGGTEQCLTDGLLG